MKRWPILNDLERRALSAELLDTASADAAAANLRDLGKIHRVTRTGQRLVEELRGEFGAGEAFRILDAGAASSDQMRQVRKAFPRCTPIASDLMERNLLAARAPKFVGDVLRLPLRDGSVEVAHCSLLLHHFDEPGAVQIVQELCRVASRLVVIQDLHRHLVPYYFLPRTQWLFGWHDLTVADGQTSVAAGWKREELERVIGQACVAKKPQIRWHFPSFRFFIAIYKGS